MTSRRNCLLQAAILLLVTTAAALCQETTATYYGVVTDSTGAIVPGAKITFTHNATGAIATKETDASGEFQFDFLRVGVYTLSIQA